MQTSPQHHGILGMELYRSFSEVHNAQMRSCYLVLGNHFGKLPMFTCAKYLRNYININLIRGYASSLLVGWHVRHHFVHQKSVPLHFQHVLKQTSAALLSPCLFACSKAATGCKCENVSPWCKTDTCGNGIYCNWKTVKAIVYMDAWNNSDELCPRKQCNSFVKFCQDMIAF